MLTKGRTTTTIAGAVRSRPSWNKRRCYSIVRISAAAATTTAAGAPAAVTRPSPRTTFDNQARLPRLPVPDLDHTMALYLEGLKPILEKREFEEVEILASRFCADEGRRLQERLREYEKTQKNSWLERLWLERAYLTSREPLMCGSSWWGEFAPDPAMPYDTKAATRTLSCNDDYTYTETQTRRAAKLVAAFLDVKHDLVDGRLAPEYGRTSTAAAAAGEDEETPLCMNQLKFQYATTRVPQREGMDSIKTQWPPLAQHVLVMIDGQCWKVPVEDSHGRASVDQIHGQLLKALDMAQDHHQQSPHEPELSIFTASNRDLWAKHYARTPEPFREDIESALFVLCLDRGNFSEDTDRAHHQFLHNYGRNRWFDAAVQVVVANTGRAGIAGEHSPSDAPAAGRILVEALPSDPRKRDPDRTVSLAPPTRLVWQGTEDHALHSDLLTAKRSATTLSSQIDSKLFHTNILGTNFIKSRAKTSPDSFFQMCLQLAYNRSEGRVGATYETASLRGFRHGRTDTIRSCNPASLAFVKVMDDGSVSKSGKVEAFRAAVTRHHEWMRLCMAGKGCDRHLLALRAMAESTNADNKHTNNDNMPLLFQHAGFQKASSFLLSTSNMSPGRVFWGGFVPTALDGYGCNYALDKEGIKASVSAWKTSGLSDSDRFRVEMERSLKDLKHLFE